MKQNKGRGTVQINRAVYSEKKLDILHNKQLPS